MNNIKESTQSMQNTYWFVSMESKIIEKKLRYRAVAMVRSLGAKCGKVIYIEYMTSYCFII